MSRVETVEEFLARGGQIDTIPRGAMAEAGWTPTQLTRLATTGNTGQGIKPPTLPESVPVTGVHRVPNTKRHEPTPPPASKPEPLAYANRNGADGAKTRAILAALAGGWYRVGQVLEATGQPVGSVCARLVQLRERGKVISTGQRPYTLWALPGTGAPDASTLPPGEFDGTPDQALRDKANAMRAQVREAQRLTVRIDRELKRRKKLRAL